MAAYLIRRILLIIPTLVLVTIIIFLTVRFIPGSVIDMMMEQLGPEAWSGSNEELEAAEDALRHKMGIDLPIHVQYGRWVAAIVTEGNFGESLWTKQPVVDEIKRAFPVSFELGFLAILIGQAIAIPIGILSAVRQDTLVDYLGRSFAIGSLSIPGFWIGTLVMVFPAIWWGWSPSLEYIPFVEDPLGNLGMFLLPATVMGMAMSGTTMRMTRTMMLEVLRQDYVRTAWAKGLKERVIVNRHVLKNALIPVVTIVGLQMPRLIGGSVIIEQIFVLPGVGRLLIETITMRDYTMLSGLNLFMASFVLMINLLIDLTYGYLDPRVQYK
jgi:peptide/nickel transport system permease protein